MLILTNGLEFQFDTPPPVREVFTPGSLGINIPEVFLTTATKVADPNLGPNPDPNPDPTAVTLALTVALTLTLTLAMTLT